jgi:hypothetical protein
MPPSRDVPEDERLCEQCNSRILGEAVVDQETTGVSQFCSTNCWQDAKHEIYEARREAKEQFELYGNDFDSWYR